MDRVMDRVQFGGLDVLYCVAWVGGGQTVRVRFCGYVYNKSNKLTTIFSHLFEYTSLP